MRIVTELVSLNSFKPWCGATYNYKRIVESGNGESFLEYLEELIPEGLTETELNDILWFEDELIDEFLGNEDELPF